MFIAQYIVLHNKEYNLSLIKQLNKIIKKSMR